MQKFLWVLTAIIICAGSILLYRNFHPPACSERGVQKYMQEKTGAIPSLRVSPLRYAKIRMNFLRANKCNPKTYNTINDKKLPLPQ